MVNAVGGVALNEAPVTGAIPVFEPSYDTNFPYFGLARVVDIIFRNNMALGRLQNLSIEPDDYIYVRLFDLLFNRSTPIVEIVSSGGLNAEIVDLAVPGLLVLKVNAASGTNQDVNLKFTHIDDPFGRYKPSYTATIGVRVK